MKNVSTLLLIATVAMMALSFGCEKENIHTTLSPKTRRLTTPNLKIVMIGDSETRRINHYWGPDTNWNTLMGFDTIVNYGFDAIGTWHLFQWNLLDEALDMNPDLLCVQIGMYDAHQNVSLDITLANYRRIMDSVQARGIDLVMQSVIPTTNYYDTLYGGFPTNGVLAQRAAIMDDSLRRICISRNIKYLDIRPGMVTTNGSRYTTFQRNDMTVDGIHINYAGYEVWKNHLTQFLIENGYLN
jgi:lysophospholipase L1-like esterase